MPTPDLNDEVTFISGIDADGNVASPSFAAWNRDNPPTYNPDFASTLKWGANLAGTSGGIVFYYFDSDADWTASEQQAFRSGFAIWSAETNIQFVESPVASANEITITRNSEGKAYFSPTAYADAPSAGAVDGPVLATMLGGLISIDTNTPGFGPIGDITAFGGFVWATLVHEIGHAIGLGHGGGYNEGDTLTGYGGLQYSPYDMEQWTLMSYLKPDSNGQYAAQNPVPGAYWGTYDFDGTPIGNSAVTPMMLDILAAQRLYGTPTDTPLSGGQVFGFNTNITGELQPFFDFSQNTLPVATLWDAGKNNTLDLSGYGSTSYVNLNPGTFSSVNGYTYNIAIAYNTSINTLIGGSGDDLIKPNAENDFITGGAGSDALVLDGTRADYSVTHGAGGTILVSKDGSTDTLTGVERLDFSNQASFSLSLFRIQADFNADGNGDLLWEATDGQTAAWLMNGTTVESGSGLVGNPGLAWTAITTADFNGDGKADILWQNSDGSAAIWTMDGADVTGGGIAGGDPGASWKVVGAGDFNGDGAADIAWQNSDGAVAVWLMKGDALVGGGIIAGVPGQVLAVGDFNGDGFGDLLSESDGQLDITHVNNDGPSNVVSLGAAPAGMQLRAVGDFNGDGQTDLLWQDDSGQAVIWLMNGDKAAVMGNVGDNPGAGWTAVAATDVDGDGRGDIIWQNTSGQAAVWLMSGIKVTGGGLIGADPGTSWHVVAG